MAYRITENYFCIIIIYYFLVINIYKHKCKALTKIHLSTSSKNCNQISNNHVSKIGGNKFVLFGFIS